MKEKLKEFGRMARLVNPQSYPEPTTEQIQETIGILDTKLQYKPINRFVNIGILEGFKASIEVLKNPDKSILEKIKKGEFVTYPTMDLKTAQGRAIVSLAYDYLAGRLDRETLVDIIKDH